MMQTRLVKSGLVQVYEAVPPEVITNVEGQKMDKRNLLLAAIGVTVVGVAKAQNPQCPVDKGMMSATGNTKVEMGKMLIEYKCLNGHVMWVVR